ncbi:MAG: hypothetical protein RL577_674 [Bacteroidota bacterium]
MFRKVFLWVLTLWFGQQTLQAQNGIVLQGEIKDIQTGAALSSVLVKVSGTVQEVMSDSLGFFQIGPLEPGFYSLEATRSGYATVTVAEALYTYDKNARIEIKMESLAESVGTVAITRSGLQKRNAESPVSSQQLSIREIERNPGGNRDISKIVQSLPGVISVPGFRNDVIIRGGAPAENKFYLDGFEIPIINHFQTQGSTGGPVGLLNVNFIKEVNLYTGAFPIQYATGLSSVMDFQQIEGNKEKGKYRFTLGSSDIGLTADGPLGENASFVFSARQSYLQFLFSALQLPFLPNFNDYQGKLTWNLSPQDRIEIVTVGALDYFRLNEQVNDKVTDALQYKSNQYILGYLPDYAQWNYTFGVSYSHRSESGVKTRYFLSRSMLNNKTQKYKDNDDSNPANKILDYTSTEEENKFRWERESYAGAWKILLGASSEFAQYGVSSYAKVLTPVSVLEVNVNSALDVWKYGTFARATRSFNGGALLGFGLRWDGSDYNDEMAKLWKQTGFNVSGSYPLSRKLAFNANIGQYHQLPSYTVMGYRQAGQGLANQNRIDYIRNRQASAGFRFSPDGETKITLEGFYKHYSDYPFALRDSISLGNLGVDFATVGNEPVSSFGTGKAYGTELLIQRRSQNGLYGLLSYTLAWSSFSDKNGQWVASSWDSRHTLSLVGGKKLKRNWELGAKWRFVTGRPYTPDDVSRSMLIANWDVKSFAIPNYDQLNSARLTSFNQFDLRVDKVWYKPHFSLNLYMDIQNFFNYQFVGPQTLIAAQAEDGTLMVDPQDPTRYQAEYLPNTSGNVLPTIGIILDF